MANASPSGTNASGTPSTPNNSDAPPQDGLPARPAIKRARPQLSCTPCRQGKLKCNRVHPVCDQCIKRSREVACLYVPPPPRNKQTQNMRGRIRNLEGLVVNLMNQKSSSSQVSYSGSEPSTASQKEGDESPAARSAPPTGPRQE